MTDLLTRASVLRLRDRGYLVIPPDEPQPLPIYDEASAVRFLCAAGHKVFVASGVRRIRTGLWVPTVGRAKARLVEYAGRHVTYRLVKVYPSEHGDITSYGLIRFCSIASFQRWRRRGRAVWR